jgi:glycosyltransferase involved in cell wall biosynthesis
MELLAVSFMLPPNLYPQAIQIGRTLYNMQARIGAVCGQVHKFESGLDCYPDFDARLAYRLQVPYEPRLTGWAHRLALHGIPFYGRSPDEFKSWVPRAEKVVLEHLSKSSNHPQAILTFGDPMSDHLLGLRLKQKLQLPWVAHFSDPWSDNPFRRRLFLSNILNRRYEAQVIRDADRVVFTSQETLDLVMRKYPQEWRTKSRVVPHGFEPSLYETPMEKSSGSILLRYVGNFYGKRTPRPLFKALAAIHQKEPGLLDQVSVELVGSVPARFLCTQSFKDLPDGLVRIVPTVTYLESLRLMSTADLLLVIDAPAETSVFLPSKLVDYLGAGVPILGLVPPGSSEKLIRQVGGEVANPQDITEIIDSLRRSIGVCKRNNSENRSFPWGISEIRDQYLAVRVAKQLHSIIAEVVN